MGGPACGIWGAAHGGGVLYRTSRLVLARSVGVGVGGVLWVHKLSLG